MAILHIEKLGGVANFGGSHARIRSRGQIDTAALSTTDLKAVESLFQAAPAASQGADGFRFRITRGTETVEAPEAHVPAAVASCVKDELV